MWWTWSHVIGPEASPLPYKDGNKVKIAESKQTRQHLKKIKDLSATGGSSNFFVKKKTYPLWNNEKPLF